MKIALLSTEMDTWAFGLRTIAAVLKAAGHPTKLMMMRTAGASFSEKELSDARAMTRDVDVIGISCFARGSEKAAQVAKALRHEKKPVIWGGVHASLNPAQCADLADIVCLGEGEEMMLELLERLEQGRDWTDVENVAFSEHGRLRANPLRPPIRDLDTLPLPDFSFENEHHLTETGFVQVSTLANVTSSGQIMFNGSRGCAFHCTYCCNRKLKELYARNGRYVRRMTVPRLIEHTQNLRRIFPLGKYFYFIDEDFGARPREELVQFSEEFPTKVGIPFACLTHPAQVSQEKMDALVKAGLIRLHVGIESGSEATRRAVYDRHVSNEVVMRAVQTISEYPQVLPTYFFIIANPYEGRDDVVASARLISQLPPGCYVTIYNLVFFPGSALYERAVRDGLIQGRGDCGYELDFLGGFNYQSHKWKAKNLYLNGLTFLMDGPSTRYLVGVVPRAAVNVLLTPRVIEFNQRHPSLIKALISLNFVLISARHWAARLVKKLMRDPTAVYNLGYRLRNGLFRAVQSKEYRHEPC